MNYRGFEREACLIYKGYFKIINWYIVDNRKYKTTKYKGRCRLINIVLDAQTFNRLHGTEGFVSMSL